MYFFSQRKTQPSLRFVFFLLDHSKDSFIFAFCTDFNKLLHRLIARVLNIVYLYRYFELNANKFEALIL